MGHIFWSCCLNATSLSPLATGKALGLDIPPTMLAFGALCGAICGGSLRGRGGAGPSHDVVGLRRRQIDHAKRRASLSAFARSFAVALGKETRNGS
jgi:hypothetical protein